MSMMQLKMLYQLARMWLAEIHRRHPMKTRLAVAALLYAVVKRLTARRRKSVRGKVIVITGAGSGLGRQLAVKFAALGAKVVCWDINARGLDEVGHQIARSGGQVWTFPCDVTNIQEVYGISERVQQEVGKVDILINNAGIVSGNWITKVPEENVIRTFNVNVLSHFWTIKALLPEMISTNSGHIVTVASAAGLAGVPKMTDYCASKFAAVGLDESLRVELQRRGVTGVKTTVICPFYINTGMFDGVRTSLPWLLPILSEEWASNRILEGVLKEEEKVVMPAILQIMPLLRGLLPVWLQDSACRWLGVSNSMDDFKGRQGPAGATGH